MNFFSSAHHDWYKRLPLNTALLVGSFAAVVAFLLTFAALLRSTSSTAAIGLIFIPIICIKAFLIFAFFGFWAGIILRGIVNTAYCKKLSFILALLIVLPASVYYLNDKIQLFIAYQQVHYIAKTSDPAALEQSFLSRDSHYVGDYGIFIIAAIAQNPHSSPELLNKIAHLDNPAIYDPLSSLVNLTPNNDRGLPAIRLVALNPNIDVETIYYLSNSKDYYVLGDLVGNRKTPVDLLRKIYQRSKTSEQGYMIYYRLAWNPNTPTEILRELVNKINFNTSYDSVESALVRNPSTPPDVIHYLETHYPKK